MYKKLIVLFLVLGAIFIFVFVSIQERVKLYKLAVEKPKINPSKVPKLVMAFYHGWYGGPYGPSKQWIHWNHWIMNTSTGKIISYHDPEKFISKDRRDIGAADYPILGPYDVRAEEVLQKHFSWAKQSGIDVFVFDWFGPPNDYIDENFKLMLNFSESHNGILLSVLYDGYEYRNAPKDEVVKELKYIITSYGKSEKFLKFEGYPVIFIYACEHFSSEEWMEIIGKLREEGLKFIFLGDFSPNHYEYSKVFDGIYIYSPDGILNFGGENSLENYYSSMKNIASQESLILCTTTSPGYDDTKVRVPGFKVSRQNGLTYNITWNLALKYNPNWVLICSWNEWHEGSEIEPSVEYDYKYTNLTLFWSSNFKSSSALKSIRS